MAPELTPTAAPRKEVASPLLVGEQSGNIIGRETGDTQAIGDRSSLRIAFHEAVNTGHNLLLLDEDELIADSTFPCEPGGVSPGILPPLIPGPTPPGSQNDLLLGELKFVVDIVFARKFVGDFDNRVEFVLSFHWPAQGDLAVRCDDFHVLCSHRKIFLCQGKSRVFGYQRSY